MTRSASLFALIALFLTLLPASALAGRKDDSCSTVAENEVHNQPVFLANQRTVMAGRANDVFAFAQRASITGVVEDNAYYFAQSLDVDGAVLGDLYVFCQNLRITGDVGGDIYAWGGEVEIAPGAVVHGNLHSGAGLIEIAGRVEGVLRGGAGEVYIDGELLGGAEIGVGRLEIGPSAVLMGDFVYTAENAATVADGARIEGDLVFRENVTVTGDEPEHAEQKKGSAFSAFKVGKWLLTYVASFLLGVILLAALGRHARKPSALLGAQPGLSLGVGFLVFVVTPIACLIACLILIGLMAGLTGIFLYAAAMIPAFLVTGLWLGDWLLARFGRANANPYGALALGLLGLALLGLIPYLGFLTDLVALIAGLGGIFLALRGKPAPVPAAA